MSQAEVILKRIMDGESDLELEFIRSLEALIKRFSVSLSNQLFVQNCDFEDYRSSGRLAALIALRNILQGKCKHNDLMAYVCTFIKWQIYRAIIKTKYPKGFRRKEKEKAPSTFDIEKFNSISTKDDTSKILLKDLFEGIHATTVDKCIFNFHLSGKTLEEIGQELHMSKSSVFNQLNTIKRRMQKYAT